MMYLSEIRSRECLVSFSRRWSAYLQISWLCYKICLTPNGKYGVTAELNGWRIRTPLVGQGPTNQNYGTGFHTETILVRVQYYPVLFDTSACRSPCPLEKCANHGALAPLFSILKIALMNKTSLILNSHHKIAGLASFLLSALVDSCHAQQYSTASPDTARTTPRAL